MTIIQSGPIPVAAQSRTGSVATSLARTADSNPAGGMDVCLLWVPYVVRQRSLRQACHSSRVVLPRECGGCECDREASIMWSPWPTRGFCAMENKNPEWKRKVKAKTGMAWKFKERFATFYRKRWKNGTKQKNVPWVVKQPKILRGP
jgi:hypothetical protein